jgi:hypothetical protein
MTDLQLGLLVIGAVAVAAVLLYNRRQERAVRREAERAFGSRHADILSGEPALRREPTIEPLPPRPAAPVAPRTDPRIDYVIRLGGVPLAALEQRFRGKALLFETDDAAHAALQMVSRRGVIGEAELSGFRAQAETLAASHGGQVSAPEMRRALEDASAFDSICADVDIQIALHVLGTQALPPESGAFQAVRRPEGGVTLLLDVPRTPDLMGSYEAMVRTAQQLGGRLVDDNGNALDERALAAIAHELEATRARLAELGIEPGSPLALRLFS